MVTASNFAIASCCFLLGGGGGGGGVDTAHSFLSPRPLVRRRPHRHYRGIGKTPLTPLSVKHKSRPSSAESKTADETTNSSSIVDDLWINNQDSKSADAPSSESSRGEEREMMMDDSDSSGSTKLVLVGGTVIVLAAAAALAVSAGKDLGIDLELGQLLKDPTASIDLILKSIETMDAQRGMLYFSSFYVLAEILAIPAVPLLTASSGYLFGTLPGTLTCLVSAAIAASISFVIGRTLLRGYVEGVLKDNPTFKSMDKAIEKEGFKLMLLLRLSPLFPFALSNYLYGASSIRFVPYFFGTLFGFAPGTFAYVYAGSIGKALTIDSATSEPWYVYAGGLAVVAALIKIAGDVASGVIDAMKEE